MTRKIITQNQHTKSTHKISKSRKNKVLVFALMGCFALVAAACGGGDEDKSAVGGDTSGGITNGSGISAGANTSEAAGYFNRAEEKFDKFTNSQTLTVNEDYYAAIDDYEKAIELDPNNHWYHYQTGYAKQWASDYSGAVENFNRAIELESGNQDYYFSRGDAKHELEDYSGAIADYTQAIELEPDNQSYWFSRGISKHLYGDNAGAIEDIDKAISFNALEIHYFWREKAVSALELEGS